MITPGVLYEFSDDWNDEEESISFSLYCIDGERHMMYYADMKSGKCYQQHEYNKYFDTSPTYYSELA